MIKYLFTDTEGNEALVDIKALEDRYYWGEYCSFPSFSAWMAAHEKDGSVKELDTITDEDAEAMKATANEILRLTDKLYEQFQIVDTDNLGNSLGDYDPIYCILSMERLCDSIKKNANKLERFH